MVRCPVPPIRRAHVPPPADARTDRRRHLGLNDANETNPNLILSVLVMSPLSHASADAHSR